VATPTSEGRLSCDELMARSGQHLAIVERLRGQSGRDDGLTQNLAADLRDALAALQQLQQALWHVRTCERGQCALCPSCVTALYVVAKPAPEAIPTRYTALPWRQP
jgi:hypothetical protein